MPRERTDAGTFAETVTLADVLGVFDEVRGPVITSSDVADALDCTTEAARQKLTRLYDRGEVDKRKTGRTVVYWRSGTAPLVDGAESGREPGVTPPADPADRRPTPDASDATRPEGADEIGDALDGWEPDAEADARMARSQTRRAAEHLRSVGEYRRAGDLKDALAEDSTLGARTWWERAVRPGLNHLADAGLVEYTKNQGYRWTGDA